MTPQEIYSYLVQSGLQPHQAAGVIGNIAQESNYNPRAVNPDSGAYGLFQHLGPRLTALNDYARRTGRPVDDPRTQLDFTIGELNGPESRARGMLMNAKTPEEATLAFSRGFERAGRNERNDNSRLSITKQFLNHMAEKYGRPILDAVIPAAQAEEAPDYAGMAREIEGSDSPQEDAAPDYADLARRIEAEQDQPIAEPQPQPEAPKAEPIAGIIPNTPDMQTAVRSTVRGLSSPASLLIDVANAPYNLAARGVNAIKPGTMDYLPMGKDYVDYALRQAGVNPEAQSNAERAATAALSAGTGAGLGSLMTKAADAEMLAPAIEAWGQSLASNPGQQMAAAAGSSLAGDTARDAGAGWAGELAARFAGGLGGSTAMGIAEGAGRGVRRTAHLTSEAGQDKAASRMLYRGTTAPKQAIRRLENEALRRENLANSKPTTAEITQDAGQAAQLRALEVSELGKKAQIGSIREARAAEVDRAINETLGKAFAIPKEGQKDVVKVLRETKQKALDDFLADKDLNLIQADATMPGRQIIALRDQHSGDSAITRYLTRMENKLGGGPISFNELWNARKEVDNQLYKVWKDTPPESKAVLAGAAEKLRALMNSALLEADPSFAPFLRRYARAATAEQRLLLGRELLRKTQNAGRRQPLADEVLGDRNISGAKINNLADLLYTDVAGELSPVGQKFTKGQRRALNASIAEKQRAEWLNRTDNQSATAPYLVEGKLLAEDIANSMIGTRPGAGSTVGRTLLELFPGRLGDYALRSIEPAIAKKLAEAYRDPDTALRYLKMMQDRPEITLRGIGSNLGRTGTLAELYGMIPR